MDRPGDYYAKQNKPVREIQIPYDLTHMWNIMNRINDEQNKTRGMDTWNRMTDLRGEVVGGTGRH